MRPAAVSLRAVALLFTLCAAAASARGDRPPRRRPGLVARRATLLPNGWKIAPAGHQLQLDDLPLAMIESPDGHALLVSNNGYARPSIAVVDLAHEYITGILSLDHAWLGLAWHPDGTRVYVSGAANNTIHELRWDGGRLRRESEITVGPPLGPPPDEDHDAFSKGFVGGLAVSPDGSTLFAVQVLARVVTVVDLMTGRVRRTIDLPAEPYTCLLSPDGSTLFVSIWGGAQVRLFDAHTLAPRGDVSVGEHPNAMAITRDGARLFVACANTNAVWAIDVAARRVTERISIALFPHAPPGSTPNHVSLAPDDSRLLVANADNNCVAVVDVTQPGRSRVAGFIPTGWYPTAAMFSRDGRRIFVLNGKGSGSSPNPRFRAGSPGNTNPQYVARLLTGTLSIVPTPSDAALQAMTRTVYAMSPYTDRVRLAPTAAPGASPIPRRVGDASPIRHVFYIIRENRTYDQVFGDLPRGDGDPALCLFGDQVTPNAHALAREFGILDNFYVDAEISYDGHSFSTAAYATDVVEKLWPTNDAKRGFPYLSEGGGALRNAYGNLTAPSQGYIWDAAIRKGVTLRSYGEFVHPDDDDQRNVAQVPGLRGRIDPDYPPFNLKVTDQRRADEWLRDFHALETAQRVPALSIIRLPNDHTSATRSGAPTPRAMVADNDLALGRIVDAITHSAVWNESAIFVLEDDAQNGPDHVDAHRSVALAISPFAQRRHVDSTMYTTSGVLRTIELILGLPPMSQYDAAATPMYAAFQPTPDPTPFTHLAARVPLDEKNDWTAYHAGVSRQLDLTDADRVPDEVMNDILWHAVKGAGAPPPPLVRRAWVISTP